MTPRELKVGEIVQINPDQTAPDKGHWFGGCLMVVTEPKGWGAQGYVLCPGPHSGAAYYRCKFENMEPTGGHAPWVYGHGNHSEGYEPT